ncbi:MAG: low molecular weight protein-tyrosine-phosphatase [Trueperella sp.]|nr:low molecular weight protein-tyrosine-phosphatase [Trueperella sp.]
MNILVVCTGNICRSPMGEIVLRAQLAAAGVAAEVSSAGVSAEESGNYIDRRAAQELRRNGYQVPEVHHAHQVTASELRAADLVLAMTVGHARSLRATMARLGIDTEKLHLWREFDGTTAVAPQGAFGPGGPLANAQPKKRSRFADFYTSDGSLDVPDPWYSTDQSGFTATLDTVEAGARGIVNWLSAQTSD